MNLKTYRARSMAECLTEVKKDLGSDAVILRTRSYKVGGMMGLGGRPMVEITASNDPVPNTFRPTVKAAVKAAAKSLGQGDQPSSQSSDQSNNQLSTRSRDRRRVPQPARTTAPGQATAAVLPTLEPSPQGPDATRDAFSDPVTAARSDVVVRPDVSAFLDRLPGRDSPEVQGPGAPDLEPKPDPLAGSGRARGVSAIATPVELRPIDSGASQALQEELASIKRMVGQVLRVSRRTAGSSVVEQGGMPEPIFDVFRTLTDQGLEPDLVDQVLGETRDELDAQELQDRAAVETTAAHRLASLIPVAAPAVDAPGTGTRVVAVVGPTGVGKTTTLAKLAATLKLRNQRRVGLITCDTYRIAAVEQLRVYADIIGLELKVAMSPQEAGRHRRAMGDCDVVLVDTAGRSPHDDRRLEELREFIDVLEPDETHLVLSLAAAEGVMSRAAERFAGLRPDRLLMTKLDESVAFGPMVNLARSLALPIGYVTTGQEVPDQFERADAARLARVILRGGGGW